MYQNVPKGVFFLCNQAKILRFCSERQEFLMKSLQIFRKVGTSSETLENKVFRRNFGFRSPHTTISGRDYPMLLVFRDSLKSLGNRGGKQWYGVI